MKKRKTRATLSIGQVGRLDLSAPATSAAFARAAEAYTRKATKSKQAAVKTLQREGILGKQGQLARAYAVKP